MRDVFLVIFVFALISVQCESVNSINNVKFIRSNKVSTQAVENVDDEFESDLKEEPLRIELELPNENGNNEHYNSDEDVKQIQTAVRANSEEEKSISNNGKRVVRQANQAHSPLYPQLPTAPPYQQYQPYGQYSQQQTNHNPNLQHGYYQANNTSPYNPSNPNQFYNQQAYKPHNYPSPNPYQTPAYGAINSQMNSTYRPGTPGYNYNNPMYPYNANQRNPPYSSSHAPNNSSNFYNPRLPNNGVPSFSPGPNLYNSNYSNQNPYGANTTPKSNRYDYPNSHGFNSSHSPYPYNANTQRPNPYSGYPSYNSYNNTQPQYPSQRPGYNAINSSYPYNPSLNSPYGAPTHNSNSSRPNSHQYPFGYSSNSTHPYSQSGQPINQFGQTGNPYPYGNPPYNGNYRGPDNTQSGRHQYNPSGPYSNPYDPRGNNTNQNNFYYPQNQNGMNYDPQKFA